ncbi:MAG: SEC-C metal-binding domain-containing protein [Acidobacteriaceae bacterium]
MASPSCGKIGRNDPCACGSGKKYKHCCLSAQSVSDDSPWKRQREASDRLTDEMQRFARREFMEDFLDAWEDFNQTPFPIPYGKHIDEGQIFLPWFLFEWDPEQPIRRRSDQPRIGLVARSFLRKAESRLSELEQMILDQATIQPVSFYEVVLSDPGERLVLRDILIGGDTEVVERSASQALQAGDICYGQIWRLPEVCTLGRMSPIRIPPGRKLEVIGLRAKLRKKIAKQSRELAARDLIRYTEEIRRTYLDIRDALLLPPRLCNTDGDPLVFHTLTFRLGSAQAAFDALAPLAWGVSKEELLESADVDDDGTLRSAEIEWRKKGNKKFKTWDNTILGRLKISDRVLIAEVNSQARADTLRREIEQRLGILAVHQKTVRQTPEELLKNRERQDAGSRTESGRQPGNFTLDPEARRQVEAHVQKQIESWIHQKIPALGGRTPIEAVGDPDGREMVEALLLDWERQVRKPAEPEIIQPDISALRRLLKLGPPSHDKMHLLPAVKPEF